MFEGLFGIAKDIGNVIEPWMVGHLILVSVMILRYYLLSRAYNKLVDYRKKNDD